MWVVIEELGIHKGKARIDIATLHETSWEGYEIKGPRDSLRRLKMQAMIYGWVFDHLWLVTTRCHLKRALKILPEWWGVMLVDEFDLVIDRRARQNPERMPIHVAGMMWKPEMRQAAIDLDVDRGVRSKRKSTICKRLVATQAIDVLRAKATQAIRARGDWRQNHKANITRCAEEQQEHCVLPKDERKDLCHVLL